MLWSTVNLFRIRHILFSSLTTCNMLPDDLSILKCQTGIYQFKKQFKIILLKHDNECWIVDTANLKSTETVPQNNLDQYSYNLKHCFNKSHDWSAHIYVNYKMFLFLNFCKFSSAIFSVMQVDDKTWIFSSKILKPTCLLKVKSVLACINFKRAVCQILSYIDDKTHL